MGEAFSNEPVYAWMAIIGTGLFLVKMLMMLMGGDTDMEGQFDHVDLDDPAHVDGGESFTLVSIQSILAFVMGTGWLGLASRLEWDLGKFQSSIVAAGFGFIMMMFTSYIFFKMKSLNEVPNTAIDERAIGLTGRAYTNIPKKGDGSGQVEITVHGKMQVLQAFSKYDSIKAFTSVKVVEVDKSGTLTVEPT